MDLNENAVELVEQVLLRHGTYRAHLAEDIVRVLAGQP